MAHKSPITCHVLDSTLGKPGAGVAVHLEKLGSAMVESLAKGSTDSDGRCLNLLSADTTLSAGLHKMTFETGDYFARDGRACFYPRVEILFNIPNPPDAHYHIPLLLSPFSYTTYRGS